MEAVKQRPHALLSDGGGQLRLHGPGYPPVSTHYGSASTPEDIYLRLPRIVADGVERPASLAAQLRGVGIRCGSRGSLDHVRLPNHGSGLGVPRRSHVSSLA